MKQDKSKIVFKGVGIEPNKFLNVINPDTMFQGIDGIMSWNTGIYGNRYDNSMPNFLIDIYQNASSVHQNLVNLKSNLILGNNLAAENDEESSIVDPIIAKRNKSGDNWRTIYGKLSKDMALFNSCVLQLIWNREGKIVEIYHIPVQDFRLGVANKYNQIEYGYISKNWGTINNSSRNTLQYTKKESVRIRMYDPQNWERYPTQLMYIRDYSYSPYAIPAYTSAIPWILIDREIAEFHRNNIKSNFFLAGMLTTLKGGMSDEQIEEYSNELSDFYAGARGRKILLSFVDQMADKPVYDQFAGGEQDNLFQILSEQTFQAIVTGHNSYPILSGRDTKSADLGGNENKLNTALLAFNQLVCEPMKTLVVDAFKRINEYNGTPNVGVVTEPLRITLPIAQPDDLTQAERRQILYGLPPLDNSQNNVDPNTQPT